MSAFIDRIMCQATGKVKYNGLAPLKSEYTISEPLYDCDLHEHVFKVEYKSVITCKKQESQYVLKRVAEELRRHIYQDVISMLFLLERAVYERDEEKILTGIREIIRELTGQS